MTTLLPHPGHLLARDLQAREAVVVTDAELAETERAHELFGGVHLAQLLGRDPVAVLKAGGETRKRGFVPRRETQLAAHRADLFLPELGLDQRRADAVLLRGLHPRPVVAEVVHVGAVDERAAAFPLRDGREPGEELLLAEEAAVHRVLRVFGISELLGPHHEVAHAEEPREARRLLQLARGVRLGVRRDEQRTRAERVLRRPREQGRIHATREGDDDALHPAEELDEAPVLGPGRGGSVAHGSNLIRS